MGDAPKGTRPADSADCQRVVVYVPRAEYAELQRVLGAEGQTVSGWARKMIRLRIAGKVR